jgi:class 3 adenylate cyclase
MASVRTVTVLITDLVGSTGLESRIGPGAADELREEHFAILRGALSENGGREVKNTGDGLMAAFESASQAVSCAVSLQQRFERRNRKSEEQLLIKVGISLGDATASDDDYFGIPVIEAARLCDHAQGAQILAKEIVAHLGAARGKASFKSIGELELKGLPEAMPTVEVGWEPLGEEGFLPIPPRLQDMPPTGFVGRADEGKRLADLFAEAAGGDRRLALISGEPGIGKTRLSTHAALELRSQGAVVLYGRCEEELTIPYGPWIEALAHYVEHAPERALRDHAEAHGGELSRMIPQLGSRLPDIRPPSDADPDTERYLLWGAVVGLLRVASREEPLVLVLDDLHWADKPTLQLLKHVASQGQGIRALVVGTYRESDLVQGHPLSEVLADLRREHGVERIGLTGLAEAEIIEIMERAAGHELDLAGRSLAKELLRETDGNPFYTGELLRHLIESGRVYQAQSGRWTVKGKLSELGLPESVREVVGRRVERLGEQGRTVLSIAAVIGRDFDVDLLLTVDDRSEEELLESLEAAVAAAVLVESASVAGRFSFAHALINHTLYEGLGATRRARLHRRVGEGLEQLLGPEPGARASELAHHWATATTAAQASDEAARKAVAYATGAGDRALEQLAPDEGVDWYEQALRLLAGASWASEEQRCELLIRLGQAQALAGHPEQRETLFEAAELARRISDSGRLVRAALANQRGRVYSEPGTVDADRVALLEDAIVAVGPADSAERAELLARLGDELQFAGDPERRMALSDEALEIVRRLDAPESLIGVVAERAIAIFSPDTLQTRRVEAEEAVRAAERIDDPLSRYHALRCRFLAAVNAGDIALAREDMAEARGLAQRTAHPIAHWFTAILCSTMAALLGRLEEAEAFAMEAFEVGSRSGQPDAAFVRESQLAPIRFDQGRLEELRPVFEVLARELPGVPACDAVLTLAQSETGMSQEAREHVRDAAKAGFAPRDIAWGAAIGAYALATARQNERASAAAMYPLLVGYEDQIAYTTVNAWLPIAHHLGAMARVTARLDLAERHLAVAAQLAEHMGAPIWLARTQIEQARVRVLRGAGAAQVAPLLEPARDTAARLGAAGLDREALATLEDLQVVSS